MNPLKKPTWQTIVVPAVLAAALFMPLFALRRIGEFDFWWWMSLNAALCVGFGFLSDRTYRQHLLDDLKKNFLKKSAIGLLSAVLLYAVFAGGNVLSRLLFPFAGTGIEQVYGFKTGASVVRIALLMILIIGPGEELFWRGFLQRLWMKRFGAVPGYLAAALLYALVHLTSGNVMLVLAAGLRALFWGYLYLRYKSVLLIAVSHTVWDLMIFLIWPMT